jgi:hypothetical protein
MYYNMKKLEYSTDINGTTKYENNNTINNTFIQRKQCSLTSSRGQPAAKQSSILIILKTKLLMPLTLIYTKSIYQQNNLKEDRYRRGSFY